MSTNSQKKEKMRNKVLYIFMDESGNFDFSSKGTKYFVLTCISTTKPLRGRNKFLSLKYELLAKGINQEHFHTTEDKQDVRNQVFLLFKELGDFEIDSVIAQKNKVNWSLYEDFDVKKKRVGFKFKMKKVEERLYKQVSETLLQYVIRRYVKSLNIGKVIIVLSALFTKRKQEFVKKHLKAYFKESYGKIPYIYFHQVKSDVNCQIADYCGWAVYVKWEKEELRPHNLISNKIKSEFDIFKPGETIYYEYKK